MSSTGAYRYWTPSELVDRERALQAAEQIADCLAFGVLQKVAQDGREKSEGLQTLAQRILDRAEL